MENPITTKDAELEMAIEKVAVTVVAVVVLTVTAVMALSCSAIGLTKHDLPLKKMNQDIND